MKISDIFRSLNGYFIEKRFVLLTVSLIFALFLIVLFLSNGFAGGAESIDNFNYTHFAFKTPKFFFDILAKPVFTLLSAPFAIFGLKGLQLFNILVGIAAGYLSYLVAKELKMKQPILAVILCIFAPVFAYNLFSGLSEILFAFVAILTSYLLLKNRYIIASIVVSFLPLIRTEGIFLIPIFAIFLIYRKQYWSILLMLSGILVYSIIGGFVNHDFFWLINQNPFFRTTGLYGTGSFFQFIKRSPGFFGIPNEIFYVMGFVAGITILLRDKKALIREFLLVFLPFLTFFFVHSFMWWSGMGNSQGNNNYMAAIVPFMAVMSTRGLTLFSLMFEIIFKRAWVKTAALYIGILSVIHIPFVVQNYPVTFDSYTKVIEHASNWLKQEDFRKSKVYFMDATFPYMLGLNPFDVSKCQKIKNTSEDFSKNIEVGSLVLYDERFFPIEKVEFDSLVNNHNLELQKIFEFDRSLRVYGRDYRVAVFKRIKPDSLVLTQNRMVAYGSKEEFKSLVFYDFERRYNKADSLYFAFDDKYDTKCIRIDSTKEKHLESEFDLSTISFEKPLELYLKLKICYKDTLNKPLSYVVEVNKDNKQVYFNEVLIESKNIPANNWSNLEYKINLPADISFNGILKLYILNRNKSTYLIDDYQVGYCFKR
jgi:hypothetical protein